MNKYKYTKTNLSKNKQGEGMSLLSLLFFMMGAVNVYGHLVTAHRNKKVLLKSTTNNIS